MPPPPSGKVATSPLRPLSDAAWKALKLAPRFDVAEQPAAYLLKAFVPDLRTEDIAVRPPPHTPNRAPIRNPPPSPFLHKWGGGSQAMSARVSE